MKKALIINEGYSNNLGDQAINKAMYDFLKEKGYKLSFLYLSDPETTKLPSYNYKVIETLINRKKSIKTKLKSYLLFFFWYIKYKNIIINTLKNNDFDLIVIGGGQLIISSGTFALSSFSTTTFWYTHLIKHYSKARIYMIGVGVSKSFNWIEKKIYLKTLKRVDEIWVRDSFSQNIIKREFNKKSTLTPDIAFYNSLKSKHKQFVKKNIVLIGVTSYNEVYKRYNNKLTKNDYFEEIYNKHIEYQSKSYQIKLFYTTITDALECKNYQDYILSKYQNEVEILEINNLEDLTYHLKDAKSVYSGRMHALILAMKMNCKVEPFLISEKLKSFNNEYLVSNMSVEELNKKILNNIKL